MAETGIPGGRGPDASTRILLTACLLSACVLLSAWWVVATLRDGTVALRSLGREAAPAAAASRGPDPQIVHRIDTRGAPSRGKAHAKVTVVEFSDFQCPFCRKAQASVDELLDRYGDRVRFVFKHFPLPSHPAAPIAHAAAAAAGEQDRFWEMHARLFAAPTEVEPEALLRSATALGLDVERFKRDVDSSALRQRIADDVAEAKTLGVRATPSFFVNGRYVGAGDAEKIAARIEEELSR